jgi:hypothetical protein
VRIDVWRSLLGAVKEIRANLRLWWSNEGLLYLQTFRSGHEALVHWLRFAAEMNLSPITTGNKKPREQWDEPAMGIGN